MPTSRGVKAMAPNLTIGDPRDPATVVGPLIREQQRQRVEGYVQSALDEGATLVVGGKRPPHLNKGFFYEPTAFINCRNDMRICQEEVFGPVLTVQTYQSQEEAVRIANDSDFGLAGMVMTHNAARGFNVARQIRTGTVIVQCCGGALGRPRSQSGQRSGARVVCARAWIVQRWRPFRWVQAERARTRAGSLGLRGVHRDQVDLGDVRLKCTRAFELWEVDCRASRCSRARAIALLA